MEATIKCPVCGATCELSNKVTVFAHITQTSCNIRIPKSNGYYCEHCKKGHVTTEMVNEFSADIKKDINKKPLMSFIEFGNGKSGVIYYEYDR